MSEPVEGGRDVGGRGQWRARREDAPAAGGHELSGGGEQPEPQAAGVGAENSATLCDLRIFMEQTAEPIMSDDVDISVGWIGKRP